MIIQIDKKKEYKKYIFYFLAISCKKNYLKTRRLGVFIFRIRKERKYMYIWGHITWIFNIYIKIIKSSVSL